MYQGFGRALKWGKTWPLKRFVQLSRAMRSECQLELSQCFAGNGWPFYQRAKKRMWEVSMDVSSFCDFDTSSGRYMCFSLLQLVSVARGLAFIILKEGIAT